MAVCPVHVLTFQTVRWTKFAVLEHADACNGCSLCEPRCPFNAITVRPAAQVKLQGGALLSSLRALLLGWEQRGHGSSRGCDACRLKPARDAAAQVCRSRWRRPARG